MTDRKWKTVVIQKGKKKPGGRVYSYPNEDGAVMLGMRISRDETVRVQVFDPDGDLVCNFEPREPQPIRVAKTDLTPRFLKPGEKRPLKRSQPKRKLTRRKK